MRVFPEITDKPKTAFQLVCEGRALSGYDQYIKTGKNSPAQIYAMSSISNLFKDSILLEHYIQGCHEVLIFLTKKIRMHKFIIDCAGVTKFYPDYLSNER